MGNVPLVIEDASPEFLTRALRSTGLSTPTARSPRVEHDRIGDGVELPGAIAWLNLPHGAPAGVILKFPTALRVGN